MTTESQEKGKDWSKIQEALDDINTESAEQVQAEPEVALDHPSYRLLQEQLTQAEQKLFEEKDKALRALAEAENTRRRIQRELENTTKFANERLIRELLPVLDSLEHAVAACQGGEAATAASLLEGVLLTQKMFQDIFGKFGISVIDPVGLTFDPNQHEIMMMQDSAEQAPNTVLVVMQKGYLLNERVVRPARVIVSK
jgi:molecular chaperone GrpE